jgi:hypothetical protein
MLYLAFSFCLHSTSKTHRSSVSPDSVPLITRISFCTVPLFSHSAANNAWLSQWSTDHNPAQAKPSSCRRMLFIYTIKASFTVTIIDKL